MRIAVPAALPAFTVRANDGAADGLALEGWVLTEWSGVPANLAREEHDAIRWVIPGDASKLDLTHAAYADVLRRL